MGFRAGEITQPTKTINYIILGITTTYPSNTPHIRSLRVDFINKRSLLKYITEHSYTTRVISRNRSGVGLDWTPIIRDPILLASPLCAEWRRSSLRPSWWRLPERGCPSQWESPALWPDCLQLQEVPNLLVKRRSRGLMSVTNNTTMVLGS